MPSVLASHFDYQFLRRIAGSFVALWAPGLGEKQPYTLAGSASSGFAFLLIIYQPKARSVVIYQLTITFHLLS